MMQRSLLVLSVTALAGLIVADRADAQVIYYGTPTYYHSANNPLVRTWSTPYVYSTYSSPIIVPTRFTYPAWGSVTYGTNGTTGPAPAVVQVGHSTYTPAAVGVGSVYYSGDSYIPPSRYYYYPYSTYGTANFEPYGAEGTFSTSPASPAPTTTYPTYAGYASPYFQTSFGQGYGGWGWGRGWGYRW